MTSWCVVARPIPDPDRRRVYIDGYGYGMTQERFCHGEAVFSVGVALDSGAYQTFSPCQIVDPPPPERMGVVIQFPVRFRMMGDPA